jgi:hypothetical protein
MPRKQRFKPSRKPQTQGAAPSNQLDDRNDIIPEHQREEQRAIQGEDSVIKGDSNIE